MDEKYFEARLSALENDYRNRVDNIKEATTLAARILDARLEGMNHIKAQLAEFLPRGEYSVAHDRLISDIKQLQILAAELRGKASQTSVNITTFIAVAGLIIAAISVMVELLIK